MNKGIWVSLFLIVTWCSWLFLKQLCCCYRQQSLKIIENSSKETRTAYSFPLKTHVNICFTVYTVHVYWYMHICTACLLHYLPPSLPPWPPPPSLASEWTGATERSQIQRVCHPPWGQVETNTAIVTLLMGCTLTARDRATLLPRLCKRKHIYGREIDTALGISSKQCLAIIFLMQLSSSYKGMPWLSSRGYCHGRLNTAPG